jgi:uncharacterized protein (TIGR00288 family)
MHRGPQAMSSVAVAPYGSPPYVHAPNAALLIDFDNVTMGIRSDLGNELRDLLSSDIITGKVAVQRAYADWRRYPQYIVPLAESSIDMIMAPAYGSSKKNATDIRLAVDAMELVFTRPEIGTYILLSGDSDFASLVTKLKEYGKYVIGVGIRESSSDLLVMNCDEYYSYNALAGLVKSGEDEVVKHDPWELVVEGVERMKRNGDVMRSDRLKQVMQEIDSTFDEKDLGMAKFSRFCQEAAQRGLIKVTRLENGPMEVDVAEAAAAPKPEARAQAHAAPAVEAERAPATEESGRRGRRGRGRGRERERERRPAGAPPASTPRQDEAAPAVEAPAKRPAGLAAEMTGERLTRDEALDLVRRAVVALTDGGSAAVPAGDVRQKAREILGRDSESLSERFFHRILSDADAAHVVQLRKRGESYEVAPAAEVEVADQVDVAATQAPEASQAARSAAGAASLRRGIRSRGGRPGGRPAQVPPELLSLGVVESPAAAVQPSSAAADAADAAASVAPTTSEKEAAGAKAPATRKRTKRAATKKATKTTARKATKKVAKTAARSTSRGRKAAASSAGEAGESAPTSEASPRAAASPSPRASTTSSGDGAGAEAKSAGDAGAATKSRRKRGARKKSAPSSSATVAAEGGEGSQA